MKKNTILAIFAIFIAISAKAIDYVEGTPLGFAAYNYNLTGGEGGTVVDVRTASELATALDTEGKMIIRVYGEIKISSELPCRSNKTIVGVGDNAIIRGQGIALNKRENVIFQNIHFMQSGDDLIKLNGAQHIWVDHCSFSDGGANPSSSDFDGTLDICKGTDFITVSYCHFFNHSKNILMSSSDGSANQDTDKLRTTFYMNFFDETYQRNPRIRFGIVHVYNNYYKNNSIYCIASCENAKALVEDNYFEGCQHPAYAKSGYADSGPGYLWTRGDNVFVNSNESWFNQELNAPPANPVVPYDPLYYYQYTPMDANLVPALVLQHAGAGKLFANPNAPTLTNPSNATQTVQEGKAINDIVFSWGGGATDVTVNGVPVEMNIVKDNGSVTISGIPTSSFSYTVTTVGGNGDAIVRNGKITVNDTGTDPSDNGGQTILANWYPFQETNISLPFVSTNGIISPSQAANEICSAGAVNLNDNTKKMTLTLTSLESLKIRIAPTGTRTLKITYGTTGTEASWTKEYKSGVYEVDLTAEIPALKTTTPIVVNIINDRSSSGNLYIHDLFVSIPNSSTSINKVNTNKDSIISESYYTISGIKVKNFNEKGIYIRKTVYTNGSVSTEKIMIK